MQETELRYLEGSAALKERMQAITGGEPNANQVAFVSACLLHGRMFWESADRASLETSPLLRYYGAAAFAKALVIAYTGKQPQNLPQGHGLKCFAGKSDTIGEYRMRASGNGLFQEFNDVAAALNRIEYLDDDGDQVHPLPAAKSDQLGDFDVSLDDCLSRTAGIEKTYKLCTGREQHLLYLYPMQGHGGLGDTFNIQVGVNIPVNTAEGLTEALASARARAPFLAKWRIREASISSGRNTLTFINLEKPEDELRELTAAEGYGFILRAGGGNQPFDPFETMPPLTGGWTSSPVSVAYAEPIAGNNVSEYSVTLAALLGLSSLVRYRPHIWTACVHRRRIGNQPVDDSLLPVIEEFLEVVKGSIPQFTARALMAGKAP